jgi:hypothetical protein
MPSDGGMTFPKDKKWLKPNGENPRERGSNPFIDCVNPPSTAGLDRFAENPVNGIQSHHLAQQNRAQMSWRGRPRFSMVSINPACSYGCPSFPRRLRVANNKPFATNKH